MTITSFHDLSNSAFIKIIQVCDIIRKVTARMQVVNSRPNSSGGGGIVGGGVAGDGGGGGGGGDGGCGVGGSGGSSSSSSSSSSSGSGGGDSILKSNISSISVSSNSSSSSFFALLNYFNMYIRLGTSVLVFRHPALPSGCKLSAAASKLSV